MPDRKDKIGPKGQEPEALATFEAAARSGSRKPERQGLTAEPQTEPHPASLEDQEKAAADILNEGTEKVAPTSRDEGA